MLRTIFQKVSQIDRVKLRLIAASVMLALIFAQLIWWVIYFEINYSRQHDSNQATDKFILDVMNNKASPEQISEYVVKYGDTYIVNQRRYEKHQNEYKRRIFMLISETAFFILLITYISYRVIKSVSNELRLVKDRNIFINSVSHELKTPIASLLLNLQTLKKHKLPPDKQAELLETGLNDVYRLSEQVNNLLTGGALLRQRQNFINDLTAESVTTDVRSEIENYLKQQQNWFKSFDARFEIDVPDGFRIEMRPEQFVIVCSNIIQNSVQYCDKSPELKISVTEEDAESLFFRRKKIGIIRFQDNGPGIPVKERKKIFQPLYRLEQDQRAIRGSGMGLYLVDEIIKRAQGEVIISSGDDDRGTVVEVRLPLASKDI